MEALVDRWNGLAETWFELVGHAGWQAGILALVGVGVVKLGRRWPAPLRYAILVLALVKFFVPPTISAPTGLFSRVELERTAQAVDAPHALAGPASATAVDRERVDPAGSTALVRAVPRPSANAISPPATTPGAAPTWKAWLALAHGLGTAIAGLVVLGQLVQLHRRVRRASPVGTGPLRERYERLAKELGVRRLPDLRLSSDGFGPAAHGLLRPGIALPVGALALEPDDLDDVLAHELAHHRRGDLVAIWLEVLLLALWWFHPIAWLVQRALRSTREDCCDDFVLARLERNRESYCRSLLRTASRLGAAAPSAVSAAWHGHPLGHRFLRIMDRTLTRRTRLTPAGWLLVLALAGLVLPGLGTAADGGDARRFSGTVVDPQGRPVAGAHVHLAPRWRDTVGFPTESPRRATTDEAGRFAFELSEQSIDDYRGEDVALIASADGHGPQWVAVDRGADAAGVELRLVEDVALTGRVVDLEGRPVPDASVKVLRVKCAADESLDALYRKVEDGSISTTRIEGGLLSRVQRAETMRHARRTTTGADGRFALEGLGGERMATVLIEAPGLESTLVRALTREDGSASFEMGQWGVMGTMEIELHGPGSTILVAPGRSVEGRVVDAATGEPVAGVGVKGVVPIVDHQEEMTVFEVINDEGGVTFIVGDPAWLRTETDGDGRFRLDGLPKGGGNHVRAYPSESAVYLDDQVRLDDPPGLATLEVELTLTAGVRLDGRVRARETGEPVEGADVLYHAAFGSGYTYAERQSAASRFWGSTDERGAFSFVVPRGPGLVTVRGSDDYDFLLDLPAERAEELQEAYEVFDVRERSAMAEVRAGDEPIELELWLETARVFAGVVLGPDGEPLAAARADGLTYGSDSYRSYRALEGAEFELRGFLPAEPRAVLFAHPERELVGALEIEPGDEGPYSVTLAPAGTVIGRLLDEDGEPRGGAVLEVLAYPEGGYGSVVHPGESVTTGADGRFRIPCVHPGIPYSVRIDDDPMSMFTEWIEARFDVQSGETQDLGDVVASSDG